VSEFPWCRGRRPRAAELRPESRIRDSIRIKVPCSATQNSSSLISASFVKCRSRPVFSDASPRSARKAARCWPLCRKAALDSQKNPAAPLDTAGKGSAGNGFQTAMPSARPPGCGGEISALRHPSIASCRLATSSSRPAWRSREWPEPAPRTRPLPPRE
jgi:hypothetical protein